MNAIAHYLKSIFSLKNRRGNVRFMFPAFLSFAALLGAAVVTSGDVSYIRLETRDATIEAGKPFSIDVYANAHTAVNAVDINLSFDPNTVEVTGVDVGESVITIWTEDPVVDNGNVMLRGGTYRRGFVGEHLIANINLVGKKTGNSSVHAADVMLLAGDGEGTPVTVAEALDSKVNLYIYDENTDPENIKVAVEVNLVTDLDGDGEVTLKDISAFMASWFNQDKMLDFNGDGRMTFRDFSIILANYFFN